MKLFELSNTTIHLLLKNLSIVFVLHVSTPHKPSKIDYVTSINSEEEGKK